LAILSPIVGKSYDTIGFPHTYLLIALSAAAFWIASAFSLSPTPRDVAPGGDVQRDTALAQADLGGADIAKVH